MICLDKKSKDFEYCEEYFKYLINTLQSFDEEDVKMFIECCEVQKILGEADRWTRSVISICQVEDKYYSIYWEEGLTEYQENCYYIESFPKEVKSKKTIDISEKIIWQDKDGEVVSEKDDTIYIYEAGIEEPEILGSGSHYYNHIESCHLDTVLFHYCQNRCNYLMRTNLKTGHKDYYDFDKKEWKN